MDLQQASLLDWILVAIWGYLIVSKELIFNILISSLFPKISFIIISKSFRFNFSIPVKVYGYSHTPYLPKYLPDSFPASLAWIYSPKILPIAPIGQLL